jgi:shikimate 5-dehydrogenase
MRPILQVVGALSTGLLHTGEVSGDVLANTTSVGMHPHDDESPVAATHLDGYQLVFDAVYTPMETKLLRVSPRKCWMCATMALRPSTPLGAFSALMWPAGCLSNTPSMRFRGIQEAKAAGCQTVSGVEMFVRQAADQFSLFTGLEPPVELMREVVMDSLG